MRTDDLLSRFEDFVGDMYIREQDVLLEDGVRMLTPVPQKPGRYVFIGDVRGFRSLMEDEALIPHSTYLVCEDEGEQLKNLQEIKLSINVIVLHLSVSDAVQYLTLVQEGKEDPANGEKILKAFFKSISVQNISSEKLRDSWLKRFPYPIKTFVACIVIHPEESGQKSEHIQRMTETLRAFFPETNLFWYHREWIVFYSQEKPASEDLDFSYEDFSALLQKYSLNAGISYVGVLPENLYTLYQTAQASIQLGIRIRIPPRVKRIYAFAQYHQLYLIHLCAKEYERVHHNHFYYMAHPDIVRLFLYDQENGTDLLDTLHAYLVNHSSLSKTAQVLYMHRNTVYNKLLKIEGIIGCPLNDIQDYSVYNLSYMVIKYYCGYQQHQLV